MRKNSERRTSFQTNHVRPEDYPQLSKEEIEHLKDAFKKHDANGNGFISKMDTFDVLKGKNLIRIIAMKLY